MITGFRECLKGAAKERAYFPVVTECWGLINIASGVSQYAVGQLMKCSSNPRLNQFQSGRHIERGATVFCQGVRQIAPCAVLVTGVAYWYNKSTTNLT